MSKRVRQTDKTSSTDSTPSPASGIAKKQKNPGIGLVGLNFSAPVAELLAGSSTVDSLTHQLSPTVSAASIRQPIMNGAQGNVASGSSANLMQTPYRPQPHFAATATPAMRFPQLPDVGALLQSQNQLPSPDDFAAMTESEKQTALFAQNSEMIRVMQSLLLFMVTQTQTIQQMMQEIQHLKGNVATPDKVLALIAEREDRQAKRNNLVLFNFPEPDQDQGDDLKVIQEVFSSVGADEAVVSKVFRMGQPREDPKTNPRPLKILTSSYEAKMKVLTGQAQCLTTPSFVAQPIRASSRSGRPKKIFIRHDLTDAERAARQELFDELNRHREAHPNVRFRINFRLGRVEQINSGNGGGPMDFH